MFKIQNKSTRILDLTNDVIFHRDLSNDVIFHRVMASPPEPPKIDWETYQKTVPIPGLVEKFKKEYEAFKVPSIPDTLTDKVDAQWKTIESEIKSFCAERQKEIDA